MTLVRVAQTDGGDVLVRIGNAGRESRVRYRALIKLVAGAQDPVGNKFPVSAYTHRESVSPVLRDTRGKTKTCSRDAFQGQVLEIGELQPLNVGFQTDSILEFNSITGCENRREFDV